MTFAPGSLIGFALVFVVSTWSASVLAGVTLSLARSRVRTLGAGAEKRAAALTLIVPPAIGGLVTLSLIGFSVAGPWLGMADHCDSHGQHIHLCVRHGGVWAEQAWAVSLISALAAVFVVRLARLAESFWSSRSRLRIVEGASSLLEASHIPVFKAPSAQSFCFVAGIRSPRIYVSASLWSRLSASEREAMLEHERSHVANGDLWRSAVLSIFALLGAPAVAAFCRRQWSEATERLCDREAADRTGAGDAVASALINMARGPRYIAGMALLPRPESLEDRVVAVLSQMRTGRRAASAMGWCVAGLVILVATASTALADPFHHSLETLFALI